jgi:hypothetical protein
MKAGEKGYAPWRNAAMRRDEKALLHKMHE